MLFIGNINDLSIWSESLTEDQIQNIHANDYEIESTLVGKWDFSEGEGQLLYDRTGNANHATINGPTWGEDVYVPPAPPVIGGNNSLIFDGENDYVEIDEGIFNLYYGEGDDCNYTISSKIKINDLEKEGIILGNGDNSTGLYIKVTVSPEKAS